jgi:hypothetical protein
MKVVDRKALIFNIKCVYFCDYPVDVPGGDGVINFYCKNKIDASGFNFTRVNRTSILDLTQELDKLWGNLDKDYRYDIRRAEKEQIKTLINQDFERFHEMSVGFQRAKGFGGFLSLQHPDLETLKKNGILFASYLGDEMLGGNAYLEDEAHFFMWLSASRRLQVDKEMANVIARANRLLHWEAIKYAKQKGIKEYDLSGIYPEEQAARDKVKQNENLFKLRFGGKIVDRYEYQKAYSPLYTFCQYLNKTINLSRR